jgi:invasion protein IalB
MKIPSLAVLTLVCATLGAPALLAQTAASDLPIGREAGAPAEGEAQGEQPGQTYVAATHGAWEQRCVRTADGNDPCQLYQLLRDGENNAVAEITIFHLPEGGPAAAGATVIAPLETLLTEEVTLQIDNNTPKKYPFAWCSPVGCVARMGLTADDLAALRRGSAARISIVPVVAPDQQVVVEASLSGFTAGFTAVSPK